MKIVTKYVLGVIGVTAVALVWTIGDSGVSAKRESAQAEDFELTLKATTTTWRVGEAPKITARITNKSGESVLLVPALDGSDAGMRYPKVEFHIERPEDAPPVGPLGRCGNTNNITPGDFKTVRTGETFDPLGNWASLYPHVFTGAGTYTVKLTYDTTGKPEEWFGFMGPLSAKGRIKRLLGEVPAMKLTSNAITLTFVDSPATPPAEGTGWDRHTSESGERG